MSTDSDPLLWSATRSSRDLYREGAYAVRQMSAILTAISLAIRERRDLSILIFGPPGTGKSNFARLVANRLSSAKPLGRKQPNVLTLDETFSTTDLQDFVTKIDKMRPVIVLLDEIDHLSDKLAHRGFSLLQLLDSRTPARRVKTQRESRVIIATASSPEHLARDYLSRINHFVYMPIFDMVSAGTLLHEWGISNENEVAKYIVTYLDGNTPYLRNLAVACSRISGSLLLSNDPREVAKGIIRYIGVLPRPADTEAFEEANSRFISMSESFIEKFASPQLEGLHVVLANKAAEFYRLGNLYYENAEMDKAMEFHQQALAIYRKLAAHDERYLPELGCSLRLLGIVSKAKMELSNAESYFLEAGSLFEQLSSKDEGFLADFTRNLMLLGELYKTKKDLDGAVRYLEKAILLKEKKESSLDPITLISAELSLAQVYLDMGELKRAESHIQSGESLLGQVENINRFLAKLLKKEYALLRKRLAKSRSMRHK